jgi:hypothetical protein
MVQSKLVFELPVVEFDAPAKLGGADECLYGDVCWQG